MGKNGWALNSFPHSYIQNEAQGEIQRNVPLQAAITHKMSALTQNEAVEDVYLSTVEPGKTNSVLTEAPRKQAED